MKRMAYFMRVVLGILLAFGAQLEPSRLGPSVRAQDNKPMEKQSQQDQTGPSRQESDPVVGPKKEPPQKKKRITPKKPAGDKPEDNFTLAVEVERINLDVVVTDKRGNFIPNLAQRNFRVYEDKIEQKISNFSPTQAPLTVVMVIEFSRTFGYFYDDVVMPAAQFIDMLRPDDWAAVVAYDLRPEILADFTQDKRELYGALRRMRMPSFSESNMFDALKDTLDRLDEVDGKKAVLLISTGLDTFSKITFDTMLKRVRTTNAVIYCIGMGQYAREYFDSHGMMGPIARLDFLQADNELNTFARLTGGKAWFPRFIGEYPSILQQVGIELRSQYSLAYAPTNTSKDGKYRKVRVEVVDENGIPVKPLSVRTREGYTAEKG